MDASKNIVTVKMTQEQLAELFSAVLNVSDDDAENLDVLNILKCNAMDILDWLPSEYAGSFRIVEWTNPSSR